MPVRFPLLHGIVKEITRSVASPPIALDPEGDIPGDPQPGLQGLLLEDGVDFILQEDGDLILKEEAGVEALGDIILFENNDLWLLEDGTGHAILE